MNIRPRHVSTTGDVFILTVRQPILSGISEAEFLRTPGTGDFWLGDRIYQYGWPRDALITSKRATVIENSWTLKLKDGRNDWHPEGVAINALTALGILLSVTIACEWRIRRRAS